MSTFLPNLRLMRPLSFIPISQTPKSIKSLKNRYHWSVQCSLTENPFILYHQEFRFHHKISTEWSITLGIRTPRTGYTKFPRCIRVYHFIISDRKKCFQQKLTYIFVWFSYVYARYNSPLCEYIYKPKIVPKLFSPQPTLFPQPHPLLLK